MKEQLEGGETREGRGGVRDGEEVTGEGETVQERGGIQETGGCGEKSDEKD